MMADSPVVSLVIPSFNQAEFLNEAIQSVLAQDYAAVELLVLDDGSTDHTREILARYTDRFFWDTHPNMGQARTLNRGWRMARGEILGYLSADDILLPQAISTSVEVLRRRPDVVLTYCDYHLIDRSSRILRRVTTPEFNYREMVVQHICPPGPGAFFRRTAFEAAGEWDGTLVQIPDYEYWLRLGLQGPFVRVPLPLAGFRVHSASQSFRMPSVSGTEEPVRVIRRYFELPGIPDGLRRDRKEALAMAHLVVARGHWLGGRYGSAMRHLVAAAVHHPRAAVSRRSLRLVSSAVLSRPRHYAERVFARIVGERH